ncbi:MULTISPECIES: C45 family autoproteolytic acyltransferase/hydolase [unclassified Ornithinimicrobium]|uniref:C45 family autoproteolytic acyltransferase/hydolase n=1 Tax=unclassified Ornithinimicrobium TaxID=2615080 RepID=UPI003852814A
MKPLIIDAHGSNLEIGRQHARGSLAMRDDVLQWAQAAVSDYPSDDETVRRRIDEVATAWRDLTPGTLEQIEGMAEVYEIPRDSLLTAVLGTYLRSLARTRGPAEGCTTFAVTGEHPFLVKNRDNDRHFLPMQTVLRVRPQSGHPWVALTTAGAPGVHSSGMNALGLCVADTHVPSSDVGPGVPRFASMMHLLELCATTEEALDYLGRTPQMGLGNLTLLDGAGSAAVVECGYRHTKVVARAGPGQDPGGNGVVTTNHHIHPVLSACLLEPEDGTPGANSRARATVVADHLSKTASVASDPDAALVAVRELAGSHVGFENSTTRAGSLCQHGKDLKAETISTAIFDPVNRSMDLCLGRPCTDPYTRIPVAPHR